MYSNIPQEMRDLDKWVLWKAEGGTKIPYNLNGKADPTNPDHWMSFADASNNIGWSYTGIGFVLTENDPYTIIDYDEECPQDVIDMFDTYTERSQSGRGVHIILKGTFDGRKRKGKVECYRDKRYIIMTGDVVLDKPIACRQSQLDTWRNMVGLVDDPQEPRVRTVKTVKEVGGIDDILERMFRAANGADLEELYTNGHRVPGKNGTASEDDATLLEGIRFYAGGDMEKSFAIFEKSACCRDKWLNRADYRKKTWDFVNKGDVWQPDILTEELMDVPDNFCDPIDSDDTPPEFPTEEDMSAPPENIWTDSDMPVLAEHHLRPDDLGILSEVVEIYTKTSPSLMLGFAMHTALSFVGTVLSRRFQTKTGNFSALYWAIVGQSGCGKGHPKSVIQHLLRSLGPGLEARWNGDGYTSEGGIFTELQKSPAHLSYIDELGDYISNSRGGISTVSSGQWRILKSIWCDSNMVEPRSYSDHSGSKNSNAQKKCACPCVSIFGASTLEQFWGSLNVGDSADGFLNRWLVYTDASKPKKNYDFEHIKTHKISDDMRSWYDALESRVSTCMKIGDDETPNTVDASKEPETDILGWGKGALDVFKEYDMVVYDKLWEKPEFVMFSRAAQMGMCVSLIVELARDPYAESVSASSAKWAMEYVHTTISQMVKYTKRNLAGSDEEKLANTVLNELRGAKDKGMNLAEMYKKKLPGGTRRNIQDALKRLTEAHLIEMKNNFRRTGSKGRPAKTWFAVEM